MTKFQTFTDALKKLCVEHQVQLSPSMYDGLEVWDLQEGQEPLHFPSIDDETEAS